MKHSVEEITLKNGAKGLLIDIPGASVMATRIQFRAGMRYAKNPEVYEIPHIVEHLAFEFFVALVVGAGDLLGGLRGAGGNTERSGAHACRFQKFSSVHRAYALVW